MQVALAAVASRAKTSLSNPAAALPSSRMESMGVTLCILGSPFPHVSEVSLYAGAGRAEAFRLHERRVVPQLDERRRDALHQRRRSTHEDVWPLSRRPGKLRQHHAVDAAAKAGPSRWRLTRDRIRHLERRIVRDEHREL